MDFRTEYNLEPFQKSITFKHKLLFLGSCFAENISSYFERFRFQATTNPFGILYHPVAINQLIDIALDKNYDAEENSFEHAGLWSNFDAHSTLSRPEKQELIKALNLAKSKTEKSLMQSSFIFITLGTAWAYKLLESNKIVANCHKIPQKHFKKLLLDIEFVEKTLNQIVTKIQNVNPITEIIFTISPVRHFKDGFVNNQWSKSILHLSVKKCIENSKNTHYFPSYELILDDLRDYRFYNKDMIHPNTLALDYIWFKIQDFYFEEKTKNLIKQVDAINKRLDHRLFNPHTEESRLFKAKTDTMVKDLKKNQPDIMF